MSPIKTTSVCNECFKAKSMFKQTGKCYDVFVFVVRLLLGLSVASKLFICVFVQEYGLLSDFNAGRRRSLSKLFTSKIGTEVLSSSVQQFSQTRFSALRDLYLLQMAALRLGEQVFIHNPIYLYCYSLCSVFVRHFLIVDFCMKLRQRFN